MNPIKLSAFITLILCYAVLIANAQKQPQIQEGSVRAPASVKIDGKLNEWPNPFINTQKYTGFLSAFNPSNRIYYTIANDDKNLYLIIRGLADGVAKKVLAGGLIFTISHTIDKKNRVKDPGNIVIKYPLPSPPQITFGVMSQLYQIDDFLSDSVANRKVIDTLSGFATDIANRAQKEIYVNGIKDIPDSVLSIYNTQGIKAAIRFTKIQPGIEIAIPLKYLGLSVDKPAAFSYNIRINAVPVASRIVADPNTDAQTVRIDQAVSGQNSGTAMAGPVPVSPNNGYAWNATDFWGEYILINQ